MFIVVLRSYIRTPLYTRFPFLSLSHLSFTSSDRFSIAEIGASQTSPSNVSPQTKDLDNDALTYSLVDSSGFFTIHSTNSIISLASGKTLDYEMQKVFDVTVQISDGNGGSASQLFTIDVLDSNDAPSFLNDFDRSIPEEPAQNTLAGASFTGFDVDTYSTWGSMTYSIVSGNTGDRFDLTNSNNAATLKASVNAQYIDFEDLPKYTLKIRVTDGGGLTADGTINVEIEDVNESPTLTVQTGLKIDENSAAGTNIGSVITSTDPDPSQSHSYDIDTTTDSNKGLFLIMGNGQIRVAGDLDYETFGTLKYVSLYVTTTDNGSPPLSDTKTIQVTVVDLNEAPVITENQQYDVDENSQNKKVGQIFYTDQDTAGSNGVGTFVIISGNKYSDEATGKSYVVFELSSDTQEIWATSSADIDYEKEPGYSVVVQLTDGGGLKAEGYVSVEINDINEAPVLDDYSLSISKHKSDMQPTCEENCAAGANIGAPLKATDQDDSGKNPEWSVLTYSITKQDDDRDTFLIDASSGQITVNEGYGDLVKGNGQESKLEQTEGQVFDITVTVADGGGLSDTANIKITTTASNFKPQFVETSISDQTFAENQGLKSPMGIDGAIFTAIDSDAGAVVTYSFDAKPAIGLTAFSINVNTGQLSTTGNTASPIKINYEKINHPDLTQGYIAFTILATDEKGAFNSHEFVLKITDVNEPPRINSASATVKENTAANTAVFIGGAIYKSDPDIADKDKLVFKLNSDGDGKFKLADTATGEIQTTSSILNFESINSFNLAIDIVDTVGNKDSTTVFITVADVNEPPNVNDLSLQVSEDAAVGFALTTAVATDPDTVFQFKWEILSGNDRGDFDLQEESGGLTVALALDYEDCDSYVLKLEVSDSGNGLPGEAALTDTALFSISVLDVNDVSYPTFNAVKYVMLTAGGTRVRLFGSNWGPTALKISQQNVATVEPVVTVGPTTNVHRLTASNCQIDARDRDAYEISCDAPEGLGKNLVWSVKVGDHQGPPVRSSFFSLSFFFSSVLFCSAGIIANNFPRFFSSRLSTLNSHLSLMN
jgi:hypothetical protein